MRLVAVAARRYVPGMTTTLRAAVLLVLGGCATTEATVKAAEAPVTPPLTSSRTGQDVAARAHVEKALSALARCEPGREVQGVTVEPSGCTRMFCREACCNQCTWKATAVGLDGVAEDVTGRLGLALALPDSALECEVAAWRQALAAKDLGLTAPFCVVK